MHEIIITCREAATAALPLIPVFWLLDRYVFRNQSRSAAYLIFSIYLSAMYAAVGLPDVTYVRFDPNFNFIPFQYMFSAWRTTLLNVLLFIPLGFFLPVFWRKFSSPIRTVGFGFCVTCFIELLQIFTFRATDVNDLMTNTLGACVGYLLGMALKKLCPRIVPQESEKDLWIILAAVFAVMYFLYPFLARLILYP